MEQVRVRVRALPSWGDEALPLKDPTNMLAGIIAGLQGVSRAAETLVGLMAGQGRRGNQLCVEPVSQEEEG